MSEDVQLEIPSDINSIAPAVDKIVAQIRASQCLAGREPDVEVALFEALANAVIHGNHEQTSKRVRISCRVEPSRRVSIIVCDQGSGFDPRAVPDPTSPENLGAEHGRGILMMKAFMDEVHFEKGGTEVHMVKHCDPPALKKAAS
ncbi:MAG: ATP-binding protein [Candidatus Acidiferrales bacterium]